MAITKEKIVDKVEVVGPYNALQVRYAWVIKEDEKEIARKFEREAIDGGHITGDDNTWVDTDVAANEDKVKNIAGVVWTATEKDALKAALIAAKG